MAFTGRISGYAGHIPKSWDPEDPLRSTRSTMSMKSSSALVGAGKQLATPRPAAYMPMTPTLSAANELLMDGLRARLKKHGARGIHGLSRKFKIMDDSGNHTLSREEFAKGLRELDLVTTDAECTALFAYFDRDGSGSVDYEEFLQRARGSMNAGRRAIVRTAFQKLDRTGDGVVSKEDLMRNYDASTHPDVQLGQKSSHEVHAEFLDTFDVGDHNGQVTLQEFLQYYDGVSVSIDDDSYFELMIRNAWHITGGKGQSQNTSNLRVLCTYEDGSQKVETVKDDLGLDLHAPGAALEVIKRLEKQGLSGIVKVDWKGGL